VVWRQPVGAGHSSPVVAGGRVFLHTKVDGKDQEQLTAFDAQTGQPAWTATYDRAAFTSIFGNGPRATPAVTGGKVYTFGVTGVLSCWDAVKGERLWQVDTLQEFNAKNLFFGMSCSPLVEGDRVVVNVGGAGHSVVAFDRHQGTVAWKSLDDPASYSSPIAIGEGAQRQLIFLTGANLVGLAPADGKPFWQFPLVDRLSESSTTPIVVGDLLIGSSVTYGSVALRLATDGGQPVAKEVWKSPELTCYFSTPVAAGKEVYLVTGSILQPSATLRCVDPGAGKELWRKPGVGRYHASLTRTGDGKLLLLEEEGALVLLEPNPKEFRELARAKVCGHTWAHPALADGRLYLRDDRELICLEFTKP
jgi:outer membrane protein assembly factor BamB